MQKFTNSNHYWVRDSNGQYFQIETSDYLINNKHRCAIDIEKTDKNGKWLAVTRYEVNRVK